MRAAVLTATAILASSFSPVAVAQTCTSDADTYPLIQTINFGMLQNLATINHAMTRDIGEKLKSGQTLSKQGEFQKACDLYVGVIRQYKFKSMGQAYMQSRPKKLRANERQGSSGSSASATDSASESASGLVGKSEKTKAPK